MKNSWPSLLMRSNSCSRLLKPTIFSSAKVQSSSNSLPLHTQSRTHPTQTMNSRNPIYVYRSLVSSFISRDFSYVGDEIKVKKDEIEEKWIGMEHRHRFLSEWIEMHWIEVRWDMCYVKVVETLLKFCYSDDITRKLKDTVIDHDLMKNVLEGFEWNPNVAKRFFNFILDKQSATDESKLNYEFYYSLHNSMLCIYGVHGLLTEFWDLAETMNTEIHMVSWSFSCKGHRYVIDTTTYQRVSEFLRKRGSVSELDKLNKLFVIQRMDNRMINIALLFNMIACNSPLDWKKLQDVLSVKLSGDFVKLVLEQESMDLKKALLLFRWIDWTSDLYEDDELTFRFIASVLGKEDDCLDRYWKVVDEIKSGSGDYERSADIATEAIKFYENALARSNTMPSINCCIYLLMKLTIVGEYPDINLKICYKIRVVNAFETNGGVLTDYMVGNVINALSSVNKTNDLNSLAKVVMSGALGQYWVQHWPTPNSDTPDMVMDRQLRARAYFLKIFKALQRGKKITFKEMEMTPLLSTGT